MEATIPELDPVGFWSPKSSSFSGSDSIVVEEAARNFLSPRLSIKQSGAPNFFVRLGSSLGTTLCNATQAKRTSQGFIGQAEHTRGIK